MFFLSSRKRLQSLLGALGEFPFDRAPDFNLEDDLPFQELNRWLSLRQVPEIHPAARALKHLIEQGSPYKMEVSLRQIGAVSASKGNYRMHLDRLPETMQLNPAENYGPLSEPEMSRLKTAVFREFGLSDGRVSLSFQQWDQLYVAMNSGASRRFALWRRLSGAHASEKLLANVTPYSLNRDILQMLREDYRAIGIKADPKLSMLLYEAREMSQQFAYLDSVSPYQSERAILLVPYPHRFSKKQLPSVLNLHRRLEFFFDIGRYLAERISAMEMAVKKV
jgi:hypothetical protein